MGESYSTFAGRQQKNVADSYSTFADSYSSGSLFFSHSLNSMKNLSNNEKSTKPKLSQQFPCFLQMLLWILKTVFCFSPETHPKTTFSKKKQKVIVDSYSTIIDQFGQQTQIIRKNFVRSILIPSVFKQKQQMKKTSLQH